MSDTPDTIPLFPITAMVDEESLAAIRYMVTNMPPSVRGDVENVCDSNHWDPHWVIAGFVIKAGLAQIEVGIDARAAQIKAEAQHAAPSHQSRSDRRARARGRHS